MTSQMQFDNCLAPANTLLLSSLLQPPNGLCFHSGIATTYSLDFRTAMSIPIHLAYMSDYGIDQTESQQIPMLDSIDRISDRLLIFTDYGRIHAPRTASSKLWPLLENNVIEVTAPKGGAFHPKILVLRFASDSKTSPKVIRLVILSRNLTVDKSWDSVLSLDGAIGDLKIEYNESIETLIRQLPDWTKIQLVKTHKNLVREIADDLIRTTWDIPKNFDSGINFFVNGLDDDKGRYYWCPRECNQLGIISPFCSEKTLADLANLSTKRQPHLISRAEDLTSVCKQNEGTLKLFKSVQIMVDDSEEVEEDDDEDKHGIGTIEGKNNVFQDSGLSGLHAKIYIAEFDKNIEITLGSGNATIASLGLEIPPVGSLKYQKNVEVFATLTGKLKNLGSVEEILGVEGFGVLTTEFELDEINQQSSEEEKIKERLERAWNKLCNLGMELRCEIEPSIEENEEEELWKVSIELQKGKELPEVKSLSVRLVSIEREVEALESIRAGNSIIFQKISLLELTRFVEFKITDEESGKAMYFCTGLKIEGLPNNRISAIYRHLIKDKKSLLQLLRLLLSEPNDPTVAMMISKKNQNSSLFRNLEDDLPILEELIDSYCQDGEKIERIDKFIKNIENQNVDEDEDFLESFKELWSVFRETRPKQNRKKTNESRNK